MATTPGVPAKRGMRDYTLNSDGVTEQSIVVDGDYFHVQQVGIAGNTVKLRFDDGPVITRSQGQGNRVYYTRVTVLAAAADTITLQLGFGYATDTRATFNAGSVTAPIEPAIHNVPLAAVTVPSGGAATLLAAADVNRAELGIAVDSTQANGVFVGDNTVANDVGLFIEPGQVVFLSTLAAVYAANQGAGGIKVRLINMRNI
jgi:hypothetical protein